MAKISLRAYTKEIDGLIDRGQYEQALAHCRYILKFIPKHIDTYRLMAKAYLESQRYGDASDVFQRVLSSIPDDFVSQLGMSIIREDEGNLDAAIWHMERAFEIQPANGAIQSELRRLYGRRDGIEPPKIRLTRGALARMYFKGELYPQAISELRAALSSDPQRPDLQLLLAKSYDRAGQKVEAITACNAVLNKLPYCIDANRIQAEILEKTGRAEDAQVYRQRAIALNPYLGQINPKMPAPEQVPDEAVVLERLDWMPDKGISSQPRWAASLGVSLGTQSASQEDVPDWLQELESSPAQVSSTDSPDLAKVSPFISETENVQKDEEVIPDWMKEAGWQPSSGDTTMAEMGYSIDEESETADDDGLAPAEIPSWLRGLAPEDAFAADQASGLEGEEIDQKLIEALDSAALPWLEESPPGPGDTISGWLGEGGSSVEEGASEGLPDWLVGATAAGLGAAVGAAASRKDDIPEEPTPEAVEPAMAEFGEEFTNELESDTAAAMPEWLTELEGAESAQPEADYEAPAEKGELPEWLAGAAAVAAVSHLDSDDEDEGGEVPDWLEAAPTGEGELEALGLEGEAVSAERTPDFAQLPDWLSEAPKEGAPGAEAEEIPDWMSEAQVPAAEGSLKEGEREDSGMPEWLMGAAAVAAVGAAAQTGSGEEEIEGVSEPLPGIEAEIPAGGVEQEPVIESAPEEISLETEEIVTPEDEEAAFAWLEGLAAKQGVSEALFLSPDERLDEPPDWIQKEAALAAGALILGADEEIQSAPEDVLEIDDFLPPELGEYDAGLAEPGELVDLSPLEGVPTDTPVEEFLPDWLRAAGPESEVAQAETEPGEESEIPAWLSQMEQSEEEALEAAAFAAAMELPEDETLDWLPDLTDELDLEVALAEQGEDQVLSDWLSKMPAEGEVTGEELDWTQPSFQGEAASEGWDAEADASAEEMLPAETVIEEEPDQTQPERGGVPLWAARAAAAVFAMDHEPAPQDEAEGPGGIPGWLEEPEPGPEATPVGMAAGRLEIEEPVIRMEDTQPSGPEAVLTDQEAPVVETEGATPLVSVEGEASAIPQAEADEILSDEDAAFAWLESLAVKQGATEALLLSPEERLDEPPEWVLEESIRAETRLQDVGVLPEAETGVEAVYQEAVSYEAAEPATKEKEADEDELPEWLIGAGAATGAAAAAILSGETEKSEAETEPSQETEAPEIVLPELEAELDELIAEEEMPELPEWLADLEPGQSEEAGWEPEMADVDSIAEAIAQEEKVTSLDINKASLIELERLPGVGFRRAQALVEYRQEHGPLENIDQLTEVAGFDQELIEELTPYLQAAASAGASTEVEEEVGVDLLIQARAAIYKADIDTALQGYQSLIQQKQNLPEIVKDLEEALYSHPIDASLWMTLGDAQMRSGQLHKAYEAYNKAEELMV